MGIKINLMAAATTSQNTVMICRQATAYLTNRQSKINPTYLSTSSSSLYRIDLFSQHRETNKKNSPVLFLPSTRRLHYYPHHRRHHHSRWPLVRPLSLLPGPLSTAYSLASTASSTALHLSLFNNMSSYGTGTNPGDGSDSSPSGSGLLDAAIPLMWNFMTIVVGLAAVIGGLLYVKQDSLLYYPEIGGIPRRPSQNPRRYRSPDEHQVPFENHSIRCSDGVRIHSWLMLRKQSSSTKMPVIVFFHGNAGNIGLRLPNALQMLQYLDAHVLLVEYRGYGDSDDAQVNEAGLKLDAEAALEFIKTHPQVDPDQIFIFGRSLGGSVAFHLALYAERNKIPIAGLMVENTFLSIADMVDALMPYVAPFKSLILRINWNSGQIVPHLTVPVLYLAGAKDELVPHYHMAELYKKTKASRLLKMHVIENGTHNESWLQGGAEYWNQMKLFMQEAVAAQASGGAGNAPISSQTYVSTQQSSGQDANAAAGGSSIPIMPSRILGMMSEAVGGSSNKETPKKKEN